MFVSTTDYRKSNIGYRLDCQDGISLQPFRNVWIFGIRSLTALVHVFNNRSLQGNLYP
jgi:hypothetical protein